jgi:hypothetical protein
VILALVTGRMWLDRSLLAMAQHVMLAHAYNLPMCLCKSSLVSVVFSKKKQSLLHFTLQKKKYYWHLSRININCTVFTFVNSVSRALVLWTPNLSTQILMNPFKRFCLWKLLLTQAGVWHDGSTNLSFSPGYR